MTAHDQMRAMLDQLMGTGRDGENNKFKVQFDDSRVCKSFLMGCCPHEILSSTRMDLGECSRIHDLALKADFEMASGEKDYFYDIDAMDHLTTFVGDCDRRTEMAKRRLKETQEELSEDSNVKAENIHKLGEQIGTKLAKAEDMGAEGNVEESLKLMNEVEALKEEKSVVEQDYRNTMPASSYQQQKLRVCEVCSAYLGIHDNDRRLADHFGGKLHLGFISIRDKLIMLNKSVQDRRAQREMEREVRRAREADEAERRRIEDEERRQKRALEREERDKAEKEADLKKRSKSRSRSRKRSRSRERGRGDRRRKSRSRSRDRRRRRSRSHERRRRRSRSRSPRRRRSRSRSRHRRSKSRSRTRRSWRSRSRGRRSRDRRSRRSRSRSRNRRSKRSRSRSKRSPSKSKRSRSPSHSKKPSSVSRSRSKSKSKDPPIPDQVSDPIPAHEPDTITKTEVPVENGSTVHEEPLPEQSLSEPMPTEMTAQT